MVLTEPRSHITRMTANGIAYQGAAALQPCISQCTRMKMMIPKQQALRAGGIWNPPFTSRPLHRIACIAQARMALHWPQLNLQECRITDIRTSLLPRQADTAGCRRGLRIPSWSPKKTTAIGVLPYRQRLKCEPGQSLQMH